jgi:hypothetical protein
MALGSPVPVSQTRRATVDVRMRLWRLIVVAVAIAYVLFLLFLVFLIVLNPS